MAPEALICVIVIVVLFPPLMVLLLTGLQWLIEHPSYKDDNED